MHTCQTAAPVKAMVLKGEQLTHESHLPSSSLLTCVFLGMCSPLCEVLAGTLKNSSFLREMCNSCVFGLIFLCFLSTRPVLWVIQFLQPREIVDFKYEVFLEVTRCKSFFFFFNLKRYILILYFYFILCIFLILCSSLELRRSAFRTYTIYLPL